MFNKYGLIDSKNTEENRHRKLAPTSRRVPRHAGHDGGSDADMTDEDVFVQRQRP